MMERRTLGHQLVALISPSLESLGFLAAWTERTGGVSQGPFRSLNLSYRGDRSEHVSRNRRRVVEALGIRPFATAGQPHGAEVRGVGRVRAGAGFGRPGGSVKRADALTTDRRRTPVAVLAADCVPLILASEGEGRLVAVHAGWRGLAAGILARALARFHQPDGVHAAIGPAIGPCHYQVGAEVPPAVEKGVGQAVVTRRDAGLFLDLPATIERALRGAGVRAVEQAEECTACAPERFFSHRRDGETGRQALIAMRL